MDTLNVVTQSGNSISFWVILICVAVVVLFMWISKYMRRHDPSPTSGVYDSVREPDTTKGTSPSDKGTKAT